MKKSWKICPSSRICYIILKYVSSFAKLYDYERQFFYFADCLAIEYCM